jgi:hypothetical protein
MHRPHQATDGLDPFVLAGFYPNVCAIGIMLRMSTIREINGFFSPIFSECCLNKS